MNKIIKTALTNAVLTALYIVLISSFLFYVPKALGQENKPDTTVLVPIMMLCLFVFSAGLTGFLVFGKPVMWYLDGKKKEAVTLLLYTLGTLLIFVFVIFGALLFTL